MTHYRTLASLLPFLAVPLLAPACDESTAPSAAPTLDGGVSFGDASHGDAAVAPECPTATTGPTHHTGDVKDGEVWTAAASPHVIDGNVNVRDGATLTIEPCAEVRFAAGTRLQVAYPLTPNTGTLIAQGTATKPITFRSDGAERWASVYVAAPGTARFAYATFENGGGESFNDGATLVATGDGDMPADPLLFLDHVTIERSRGTGASLKAGATFIAGSQELVVTASGDDEGPYALEISEHAIDAVPTGKYTGNKKDEILVRTEGGGVAGEGLLVDATLHDRGVPYHMGADANDHFRIGGGPDGTLATLTIEPGVVMKFEPKTSFEVQHFTSDKPATAVVRALGTADKPIVMTSGAENPKAGDWRGLWFGGVPQAANQLDHVRIEYAGYDCSCVMVTCSANVTEYEGAVIFSNPPPSAFITNSVFKEIAGHGVVHGYDGTFVDFRPTNTFDGVTGCVQTLPRSATTACPVPKPACDGL